MKLGDGYHQYKFKKAHLPDDRTVITFTLIYKILSGVNSNDLWVESMTSDGICAVTWHSLRM